MLTVAAGAEALMFSVVITEIYNNVFANEWIALTMETQSGEQQHLLQQHDSELCSHRARNRMLAVQPRFKK